MRFAAKRPTVTTKAPIKEPSCIGVQINAKSQSGRPLIRSKRVPSHPGTEPGDAMTQVAATAKSAAAATSIGMRDRCGVVGTAREAYR